MEISSKGALCGSVYFIVAAVQILDSVLSYLTIVTFYMEQTGCLCQNLAELLCCLISKSSLLCFSCKKNQIKLKDQLLIQVYLAGDINLEWGKRGGSFQFVQD